MEEVEEGVLLLDSEVEEVELVEEILVPAAEPVSPTPILQTPELGSEVPEGAPAILPLNIPVICPSCSSRFEIAFGNSSAMCPVCDERIVL